MKKIFIKDLLLGKDVSLPLLVISRKKNLTSRGSTYLALELADKSGRLAAKVWDDADVLYQNLPEGQVALIGGHVDQYQGKPQLVIKTAKILDSGDFDWADYLKSAPRPVLDMKKDLLSLVSEIVDNDFRELVLAAFGHPKTSLFWTIPGAKSFHHAYVGGLLEHSLSVATLARLVANHYSDTLNGDLLVAGALLHDIGKCWEFSTGPVTDYTTPGRLLGHLAMGTMFLEELAVSLPGFPQEKLLLLEHLILSHHGELSLGSPQTPKLLEALALHSLDELDAKQNGVGGFIKQETSGSEGGKWTGYHRLMGSYYMTTPMGQLRVSSDDFGIAADPEPGTSEISFESFKSAATVQEEPWVSPVAESGGKNEESSTASEAKVGSEATEMHDSDSVLEVDNSFSPQLSSEFTSKIQEESKRTIKEDGIVTPESIRAKMIKIDDESEGGLF